jgi:colanic acid/amylovoran biosynthesis glycosyltransferase
MNVIVSQALATGLPVITTNHSGLPEQVLDGKNGAIVPEGDFEALAEKIVFLMEHSELWPEYGRFGRSHTLDAYDSKKLIDRQVEYYLTVVSCAHRSGANDWDNSSTPDVLVPK